MTEHSISEPLFRRAMTAAYDLHRLQPQADFGARLAKVAGQALDCDSAMLVQVDIDRRDYRLDTWPPNQFVQADRAAVVRMHRAGHPFIARCEVSRSTRAERLSDLQPRAVFERTELYRTLYRPLGIEHQLLMLVASPDALWRAIVLNRRARDFTDAEQRVLEALWPHMMLAQRNHRRRLRPSFTAAPIDGVLPAEGPGIIVVSSEGKVTLCSEQARVRLAHYFDPVSLLHGVSLPPPVLDWVRQRVQREALGMGLRIERRDPMVVRKGERCLMLDLNVDRGKDRHLLMLDEAILNAPPASLVALGLTPRETEVMSWVAQGKTSREIGMILGSSARTVQKHMEHIFEKLGVETRSAATLRAWQVARFDAIGRSAAIRPSS